MRNVNAQEHNNPAVLNSQRSGPSVWKFLLRTLCNCSDASQQLALNSFIHGCADFYWLLGGKKQFSLHPA